jgi:putative addiction module CopG family antidote
MRYICHKTGTVMKQTFGSHLDGFIANSIAQGNYKDANEVLRAGLEALEEKQKQERKEWAKWVAAELEKGEASGIAVDFDPDEFLARKHAEWNAKGVNK